MDKKVIEKDVAIIGAGPAGVGAALKLKEKGVDFIIIEGYTPGGKINIAPRVDNYPGYKMIPGPDLAYVFFQRLMDNDINIHGETVLSLTKKDDRFILDCDFSIVKTRCVLIASGTKEKKIGLDKEDAFFGKGVSYCALCDGHFFKGQDVIVVGGGNSALKEALHLTKIVNKLYVVHRRNEFRGNAKLVEELKQHDNIEILTPYVPIEILGEDKFEGLVIKNTSDDTLLTIKAQGFFPLIGQNPNTKFVDIPNLLDDYKSIPVINRKLETNVEGVFAAGDVLPRDIKQIYLAEHDGMVVANSIIEYLNKKDEKHD